MKWRRWDKEEKGGGDLREGWVNVEDIFSIFSSPVRLILTFGHNQRNRTEKSEGERGGIYSSAWMESEGAT